MKILSWPKIFRTKLGFNDILLSFDKSLEIFMNCTWCIKRCTSIPTIRDGDNSSTILSDFEEHWHGEIEVSTRRVTPAAIVVRKSVIGWTKVSCSDYNGRAARMTPPRVIRALDFKTRAAAQSVVEQCGAESGRVDTVTLAVQVTVPTSTTCITNIN